MPCTVLAALTGKPPAEYPRSVESCANCAAPAAARSRSAIATSVAAAAAGTRREAEARGWQRRLRVFGVATADLYPRIAVGASAGSTGATSDFLRTPTKPLRHRGWPSTGRRNQSLGSRAPHRPRRMPPPKFRPGPSSMPWLLTALRDAESALSHLQPRSGTRYSDPHQQRRLVQSEAEQTGETASMVGGKDRLFWLLAGCATDTGLGG